MSSVCRYEHVVIWTQMKVEPGIISPRPRPAICQTQEISPVCGYHGDNYRFLPEIAHCMAEAARRACRSSLSDRVLWPAVRHPVFNKEDSNFKNPSFTDTSQTILCKWSSLQASLCAEGLIGIVLYLRQSHFSQTVQSGRFIPARIRLAHYGPVRRHLWQEGSVRSQTWPSGMGEHGDTKA